MTTASLWLPQPQVAPAVGLPTAVRIFEVGPRDGLQAEPEILSTAVKAEFCRRLAATGIAEIEATSFVPPSWIPQLADAEELMAALATGSVVPSVALVPNLRGLERALAAGLRMVSVVASSTESFAAANLNTTVVGATERATAVVAAATEVGVPVRGYLSMCFGDPWEGPVDEHRVATLATELYAAGCSTVALSDTIGVGTPGQVLRILELTVAAGVPLDAIALHLHDTYGQSLANVFAALQAGVTEFDSSAGGLGRCPYAPGAAGNLATEDLVWMLHGLGIATGIDLDALVETSRWMSVQLGRPVPSRIVTARSALLSPPRDRVSPVRTTRESTP